MGFKDLYTHINAVIAIGPATLAADNTPAAVDMRDYTARMLELAIGVGGITFDGTNKIEFKLTHSDDDSTYTDVAQSDVQGVTVATGGIVKSLVAAHASADLTRVGYVGGKRYCKLLADFSGTHGTGTPICATWDLGGKYIEPVTLPV
jgi:hypothetical protein